VGGPGDHRDPVSGVDRPAGDDGEVGACTAVLGKAAQPTRLTHLVLERRAGDARSRDLEHHPFTHPPLLADQAGVDVEVAGGEVLAEHSVRQLAAESLSPLVELLAREGVDGLLVPAVMPDVADEVALDPAPESSALGSRGTKHDGLDRTLGDPRVRHQLGRVGLGVPDVEGVHMGGHAPSLGNHPAVSAAPRRRTGRRLGAR